MLESERPVLHAIDDIIGSGGGVVESRIENIPADETWHYVVGQVVEANISGKKTKRLDTKFERKKVTFTEAEFPPLLEWNVGDVIVFEHEAGDPPKELHLLDHLGQAGDLETEKVRLAYEIGNGRMFPKPVREEIKDLEDLGERAIENEINRVGGESGILKSADPHWREKYVHGKDRLDMRNVLTMTVDPKSAKDYDDALSAQQVTVPYKGHKKNFIEIGVHIADVTHFLSMKKGAPGHEIYREGMRRAFTAYFEGSAFPMLPAVLSEQLCSLNEGIDRLAFSTLFYIDPDAGEMVPELTWQGKVVINSDKRFSYEDADELRQKDGALSAEDEKRRAALRDLTLYGKKLRGVREKRGTVFFPNSDEPDAAYDAESKEMLSVKFKQSYEMNRVIEDWMIHANEAMASTTTLKNIATKGVFPTLLRAHFPPVLDDLRKIATDFGAFRIVHKIDSHKRQSEDTKSLAVGDKKTPFVNEIVRDLLKFSESGGSKKAKDGELSTPLADNFRESREVAIRQRVMELFTKAQYTTELKEHFGLASFPYTHATSPIRRSADILVHYLLQAALEGKNQSAFNEASVEMLSAMLKRANERELEIDRAARRSWRMRGAALLKEQIGTTVRVHIQGMETKKGPPLLFVQMRLPKGGFPLTFMVPLKQLKNAPQHRQQINDLVGKEISVRLINTDSTKGNVELEYVDSLTKKPSQTLVKSELVPMIKTALRKEAQQIERMFSVTLAAQQKMAAELQDIQKKIETMTEKTPQTVVENWGTRLGSLRVRLLYFGEVHEILPAVDPSPGAALAALSDPIDAVPVAVTTKNDVAPDSDRTSRLERMRQELADIRRQTAALRAEKGAVEPTSGSDRLKVMQQTLAKIRGQTAALRRSAEQRPTKKK